ncbi:carboxypeptidase-like regulatory domain-containing protein, partial [Terriglobus sp. YAF25]
MKRVLLASLLVCLPVVGTSFCSRDALAQTVTGTLVGTVTDSSGAAVAGAKVIAFDTKTNQSVTAMTASDGSYRIPNLDPDDYRVDVSAAGFQQISIAHTQLLLNATLRNDIQLKVGDTSEKVEVEATAGVISTESSSISSIIDVKAAERLPLNGRTIDRLIIFTAGMTSDSASSPNLSGSLRWGGSYYTVDGGNFNDLGNGAGAYSYATNLSSMPSTEVVQEMKIESNLAKAEFEGSSSISIMTKSGTNAFHGELYELNRNRAYAARDYFARAGTTVKPQLNRNEFGGTIGGPIWK